MPANVRRHFTFLLTGTNHCIFSYMYPQRLTLFFLFTLLLPLGINGQYFKFKVYTQKEGLCSNSVNALVKDNKGFIWLATSHGLSRFDGNAFDNFYASRLKAGSIASNDVSNVYLDRANKLWASTIAGLSCYNASTGLFRNYFVDTSLAKYAGGFNTMMEDSTGHMWVGTWGELLVLDTASGRFRRSGWGRFVEQNRPEGGNHSRIMVFGLLKKSANEIWVLSSYGLYSVNMYTHAFRYYPSTLIADYFGCQLHYMDNEGKVWIGSYNKGLFCYDTLTRQWANFNTPPAWVSQPNLDWVYGATAYNKDTLAYCGTGSIIFFNTRTRTYINRYEINTAGLLPTAPSGFVLLRDKDLTWIASGTGLVRMQKVDTLFKKVTPLESSYEIFRIAVNETDKSLLLYDDKRNAVVSYNEETRITKPYTLTGGKLLGGELSNFRQVSKDSGYITTDTGFYVCNSTTLNAAKIPLPAKLFKENDWSLRNMEIDVNGNVWVRSRRQGILLYDKRKNQTNFTAWIKPSVDKAYSGMYYDPLTNQLWVSVEREGVYAYNVITQHVIHYLLAGYPDNIPASISYITGDDNGNIYLGDANKGLYIFNNSSKSFTVVTTGDGLPSDKIRFVATNKKNYVWILTAGGVCRYNLHTQRIEQINGADEIPADISSITCTADGTLYIPYTNSYLKFSEAGLSTGMEEPGIYIRNIIADNNPVLPANNIKVDYTVKNIALQFGALYFGNLPLPAFEYRINNDKNWSKIEYSNTLNFSTLSPGKYNLDVRLYGHESIYHVQLIVTPPFWRTSWFIIVAAVVLLLTILLLFVIRVRSIRRQAAIKNKIVETEMMALRAQMNPHFIFNCISSIDNFIQDNDKDNASAWLNKFAKLIRSILDNSRNDVVPFWKDWETLKLYVELEQLRSDDNFEFVTDIAPGLLHGHYRVPPLIIQPYVENAIHHGLKHITGKRPLLTVTATLDGNNLIYTVEDNGIGRQEAQKYNQHITAGHKSYGMQIVQDRVNLFNSYNTYISVEDVINDDGFIAGTKVTVILEV